MKDFPKDGFITGERFIPGELGQEVIIPIKWIHKYMAENIASRFKLNKMKDEIIIEGIRYKRVEDELTLEDCVKYNNIALTWKGNQLPLLSSTEGFGLYPTEAIAEKVLLYGLLQSVAYKLNEGKTGKWIICLCDGKPYVADWKIISNQYGNPVFATKELAEQAIKIFENSKFDLKKLFQ